MLRNKIKTYSKPLLNNVNPVCFFTSSSSRIDLSSNSNITENILKKIGENLHLKVDHPLNLTKAKIEKFCTDYATVNGRNQFKIFDNFSPLVDTKSCFDDLRIPKDHESRKRSDTYYVSDELVLRTHTSAHQCQLLRSGVTSFLCTGDVYRRDEIDSTHYPVFHQMEGVRLFSDSELQGGNPRTV